MTANPTQRRCIDANGNTRRPIPTQELDSSSRSGGALHWRRRTRMDSSIHPCSRIWRMDTSGRREVDNLRQRRSRAMSSRATRVLSHRRVRLFATLASLSHPRCRLAALRDDEGVASRPHARRRVPSHRRVRLFATLTSLLRPRLPTCCSSRRARQHHALTRPACAAIPAQEIGQCLGRVNRTSYTDARVASSTHPYSRIWRLDVLDGAKAKGVGAYVSLPYSPPSSAHSSRPGPHASLLKNWYGGQDPSWR